MRRAPRRAKAATDDAAKQASDDDDAGVAAKRSPAGRLTGHSARALRQLADGPRDADPSAFFRSGTRLMAEIFGSRYGILARYADPERCFLRTLVLWEGQNFAEPFEYALAGTPCADSLSRGRIVIESGVQQRYPEDAVLLAMGAESYIGAALPGADGAAIGVLYVIHDASLAADDEALALLQLFAQRFAFELERQDCQTDLSASEARFRGFAAIAADWFWEQDAALRYSYLSLGLGRVTGWPQRRFLGCDRAAAFGDDVEADADWCLCLQDAAAHRPYQITYRLRRTDGQWLWIHECAQPLRDDQSGEFLGFRGVARDVSAEQLLVRGWRERRDELQQQPYERARLAALGALAAGAAHDLRNPLAAVRNAVRYLRHKAPGWLVGQLPDALASPADSPAEKLAEYLGIIDVEVAQAEGMLVELLDAVRPRTLLWSEFAVDQLCEELLAGGLLPGSVALHFTDPRPLALRADRALLRQLLANLLGNAAAAMGGCGEIRVSVDCDASDQWLRIEDGGPGVATAHRERIFEPLFTTRSDGHGLGLWVARDIAHRHGGELLLEEGEGRGARFALRLPAVPTGTDRVATVGVAQSPHR